MATTAVAARAMDCFIFRINIQTKSKKDDATLCIDAPYLLGDGPNLPNWFKDKMSVIKNETVDNVTRLVPENKRTELTENMKENQLHDSKSTSTKHVGDEQCTKITEYMKQTRSCNFETSITDQNNQGNREAHSAICMGSSQTNAKPTIKKPPKQLLNEYYAKLHIKAEKLNYTTIKHEEVIKFTSLFTCPSSGETFMGGRLKDVEYSEEDGLFWYGKWFCLILESVLHYVLSILTLFTLFMLMIH